jgi:hypothetical protein
MTNLSPAAASIVLAFDDAYEIGRRCHRQGV